MSTPTTDPAGVDQAVTVASYEEQIAALEAKLAAAQAKNPDAPAAATGGTVSPGDVVLHDVFDHAVQRTRTQALVVIGTTTVRVVPDDPDDTRRVTKVHAVPLGWVDELAAVPKTYPVPLVGANAYAELSQADYRLQ